MRIETCKHCEGSGKVEVCERCNNTGFMPHTQKVVGYFWEDNKWRDNFSQERCDNPKCKVKITVTN